MAKEWKSRSVRLDDEVWVALCQHELSANKLLRAALGLDRPRISEVPEIDLTGEEYGQTIRPELPPYRESDVWSDGKKRHVVDGELRAVKRNQRGPRQKGDKTR